MSQKQVYQHFSDREQNPGIEMGTTLVANTIEEGSDKVFAYFNKICLANCSVIALTGAS